MMKIYDLKADPHQGIRLNGYLTLRVEGLTNMGSAEFVIFSAMAERGIV